MEDYLSLLVDLTNAFQNLSFLQAKHLEELTEAFTPNKNNLEIPRAILQESIHNLKQRQEEQVIQHKEGIYYLLEAILQQACTLIENNIKGSESEKNLELRKLEGMVQIFSQYEQDLEAFYKTKMPYTPVKRIFTHFFTKPFKTPLNAQVPKHYFGLFPSLLVEDNKKQPHPNNSHETFSKFSPNFSEVD